MCTKRRMGRGVRGEGGRGKGGKLNHGRVTVAQEVITCDGLAIRQMR